MISGDLIRLKNLIDDCVRVAKSIQREAERLTAEELVHLNEYIQGSAPQFKDILKNTVNSDFKLDYLSGFVPR